MERAKLKNSTEALIIIAQQALSARSIKAGVYHTRQDLRYRLCREAAEIVQHIVTAPWIKKDFPMWKIKWNKHIKSRNKIFIGETLTNYTHISHTLSVSHSFIFCSMISKYRLWPDFSSLLTRNVLNILEDNLGRHQLFFGSDCEQSFLFFKHLSDIFSFSPDLWYIIIPL